MIRLFVVQSRLSIIDHHHHQFVGIENPFGGIKNPFYGLTSLENICPTNKPQISSKIFINISDISYEHRIPLGLVNVGLGGEIPALVAVLKRFMDIESPD